MMRVLCKLVGGPLRGRYSPRSSTQDMKSAYRQLGVRDDCRQYHITALYDQVVKSWRFGLLHGLAFGLSAAVLEFNRVPEHLVAVARRWLALPVIHFYDDFGPSTSPPRMVP